MAMESAHKDFTLAPRASGKVSWLETIGLTGLAIGLGYVLVPQDPLLIQGSFPWMVLAPLLMGMRYGFIRGLASAALLVLMLFVYRLDAGTPYHEIPASFVVGVLLCGMLVGEFRDIWERRLQRLDLANDYRQLRLDEFTRAHHILRISHDRLEQRVAGNDQSLRSSLLGLREQLRDLPREDDALAALADPILSVFTQYGSLRVAGLYRMGADGKLQGKPLSALGEIRAFDTDDLLVRLCLERGELVSVREELVERGENLRHSELLACVPLIDTEERILGVLAIQQMPFFAFNERTLSLMAILAGHIADLLHSDPVALQLDSADAQLFSQNLKRSLLDARDHDLPAYLFAFELEDGGNSTGLLRLITDSQRGLDLQLRQRNARGSHCVLVLLPLTSEDGAQGYRERLQGLLAEHYGHEQTLEALGVRTHSYALDANTDREALRHFLFNGCALHDQQVAI